MSESPELTNESTEDNLSLSWIELIAWILLLIGVILLIVFGFYLYYRKNKITSISIENYLNSVFNKNFI